VNTSAEAPFPNRSRRFLTSFCISAFLFILAAPVWADPIITTPYLGITRITDSIALPAPADQMTGSGLGPHSANINVIQIDLKAPGIAFKLSPGNGDAPGESLTQKQLSNFSRRRMRSWR
jgi:hypothetical protein